MDDAVKTALQLQHWAFLPASGITLSSLFRVWMNNVGVGNTKCSACSILNVQDKDIKLVLGHDGPVITMQVSQCHSNASICQRSLPSL